MKMLVFAIYDSKAKYYKHPFLMKSKGEVLRGFIDLANDEKTEIGKHPEDFVLFYIGTFDEVSGRYEMLDAKESLGTAIEFKKDKGQISLLKE